MDSTRLPVRVGLGPQRSATLELGVGILRQVCHHGLLIHVRIDQLLWLDQLTHIKPIVGESHRLRGVLHSILGIPHLPVGTQAWRTGINQSTHSLTRGPVIGEVINGHLGYPGVYPVQQPANTHTHI